MDSSGNSGSKTDYQGQPDPVPGTLLLVLTCGSVLLFTITIAHGAVTLVPSFEPMFRDLGQKLPMITVLLLKITPVVPALIPVAMGISLM